MHRFSNTIDPFAYVPHLARIQAVVFDFGGVLMEAGPRHAAQFGMLHGLSQEAWEQLARELFVEGDQWNAVERGERTLDDFGVYLQSRLRALGGKMDVGDVYQLMGDMENPQETPLREETVRVCAALHRVMPVALLTNNVREWSALWRKRLQVKALFDMVIDSCEVGIRKPDARIYRVVEERLQLMGDALLFVDDLGVNLKTASALKWQTVRATPHGKEALLVLNQLLVLRKGAPA